MASLFHFPFLDQLDQIVATLTQVLKNQRKIMATLDDVEMKLTAAETAGDAVAELLHTIHDELVALIAQGPTAARLQSLADRIDADAAKWQAAADANPDPAMTPGPTGATGP